LAKSKDQFMKTLDEALDGNAAARHRLAEMPKDQFDARTNALFGFAPVTAQFTIKLRDEEMPAFEQERKEKEAKAQVDAARVKLEEEKQQRDADLKRRIQQDAERADRKRK